MARKASDLTVAIRTLCEKTNFAITYAQARPKLLAMGFQLADEPAEKTEVYATWEKFAKQRPNQRFANASETKAWYKSTIRDASLPANSLDAIMAEDEVQQAFINERRSFDTTKSNYLRAVGHVGSDKPDVEAPVQVKRLKPKVGIGMTDAELITWLVEQGGVAAIESKIAEMESAVVEMSAKLKKATAAITKLTSAA